MATDSHHFFITCEVLLKILREKFPCVPEHAELAEEYDVAIIWDSDEVSK